MALAEVALKLAATDTDRAERIAQSLTAKLEGICAYQNREAAKIRAIGSEGPGRRA
jgi:hypothetical protein